MTRYGKADATWVTDRRRAWAFVIVSIVLVGAGREDTASRYADAVERYRRGDMQAALETVDRALEVEPTASGLWPLRGWILLRLGRPAEADEAFVRALSAEPGNADALAGRGYAALRSDDATAALARFVEALEEAPGQGDAARGQVIALVRMGRHEEAAAKLRPLLADHPDEPGLREIEVRVEAGLQRPRTERRPRPPMAPSIPLRVIARAGDRYLEVAGEDAAFRSLFVKGVNLGVALAGRFPTQFPEDPAVYHDWLDRIAAMNANVVRTYTLLPPAFYRALEDHNRDHADRRLWLVQGAWVELPPGDDFDDPGFKDSFEREIERVIDAYHGNLDLPARRGHASGRYRADVSEHVLALILGREWEPFAVVAHNLLHPGHHSYHGRFARMESGSAMEAWLAWVCDTGVAYETDRYRVQRPVAFSNWPTLDPLHHPTETSRREENALRRSRGEEVREKDVPQYDDDVVSVDSERIVPTPENRAGFFASYHVYPYYPDFMILEDEYRDAVAATGPSPYGDYLRALKQHHRSQPLLVAELGVPTSRGVAHVHPLGWSHGGHTPREQGVLEARMMDDVLESGCAGGVLFAWLDEWFKHNWMVVDFEAPADRDRLWHNLIDPEENFGILGVVADGGPRLDGDASDWDAIAGAFVREWDGAAGCGAVERSAIRRAAATVDAAHLHLLLEVAGANCDGDRAFDWGRLRILVGIDTHGDEAGERRLAPGDARVLPTGVEFRVRLRGPGRSDIHVVPSYDVGSHLASGPFVSLAAADGEFMAMTRETNRRRIGRDGTEYPAVLVNQSPLRFAERGSAPTTLDDVATGLDGTTGVIELRLPWTLLNVTDPSSHRVLDQAGSHLPPFDTSETGRFVFHLSIRDSGGSELDARMLGPFRWDGWDEPRARLEPKASYAILQEAFAALPDSPETMR